MKAKDLTTANDVAKVVEPEASRERGGVQSIERAFSILMQIAQHPDGISLADLAKRVELHTSTTFHLVRTLVETGAARQDRETKRYHLGRLIFSLAANSASEVELVTMATPFIEDLARMSGETTHFALRSGHDIVIAARVAGTGAFQLVERNGGIRPAHCTSLGKVLLAAMSPPQLEEYLTAMPLVAYTPKTIVDPERFREELDHVRRSGIGYDDQEFNDEVRCVAAPVRNFSGHVVGAVGASGPVWRMTLPRLQDVAQKVRATAAELSRELGCHG
ncbi:IclR family transcriptional regulator [Xanthobacter autotrophicus DSM 431]|uniref:IclR family transcriptional regulator n=1 Tax=Xanthobacter nonsaccharivorans TaxID=3119912 RepID=UPI003727699B